MAARVIAIFIEIAEGVAVDKLVVKPPGHHNQYGGIVGSAFALRDDMLWEHDGNVMRLELHGAHVEKIVQLAAAA